MPKPKLSPNDSLMDRLRERRRWAIKRLGKRFTRGIADFLGRQSLVPDTPVVPNDPFPFLKPFAENWQAIRDEVVEILKHREAIPAFQELSRDQYKIATGKNWRTFILYGFGERAEKNCAQAPLTAKLLSQVPEIQTAWFSILAPGFHIKAHRGVSKGILRAHLGLIVPKDAEKCRIRVDDQIKVWRPGEIFVFDDTFEHEVWNDTDEERVILLFDFNRPMRVWGRMINTAFVKLVKMSAYYKEPRKALDSWEDRFEAATRRADATLEKLSDPAD